MNMEAEKHDFTLIVQESVGKYGMGTSHLTRAGFEVDFSS